MWFMNSNQFIPIRFFSLVLAILVALGMSPSRAEELKPGIGAGNVSLLDRYSPDQKKKLLAGEAIFESSKSQNPDDGKEVLGRTAILINQPVAECFKIFCDFDRQYLYYPRMTISRVLKSEGNQVQIYKELDFALATVKYTHILTIDPDDHRVDFVTDPTGKNSVKFTRGYFRFERVDEGRSLFTYEMKKMDTGFRIPGFVKTFLSKQDLPEIAVNLKKRIESGGMWEKKQ